MNLKSLAVAAAALLSLPAFAASVDRREAVQQARIVEGVRSGELTRHEAVRLERREGRVEREIARDRAFNGGFLTPGERARIEHQENRVSRDIYRQKDDGQVR